MRITSTRQINNAAQSYLKTNPGVIAVRGYAQQAFGIATGQLSSPIAAPSTNLPKDSQGNKTAQHAANVARAAFNRLFPKA